ncbi:MAG TPA: YbaK/EbsC family protein [Anaerolineae bacterium]|nr:YbaK/EbsC family protein [Anaerolineae bacterium]
MPTVNNATRMLDARKIPYTLHSLPREKLSALETAKLLGVPPGLVYKTIVVARENAGHPLLVLVPADSAVDLKKVATAVGVKRVQLPSQQEAETLTGLEAGGISPLLLLNRGFRVLIDVSASELPEIHVSAGQRGLNLKLKVEDLAEITGAQFADVSVSDEGAKPKVEQRTSP